MNIIAVLYGMKGTAYWILFFSVIHFANAVIFLKVLGTLAIAGFAVGFLLISIGNYIILKGKSAGSGMKALPLFHVAMLIYSARNYDYTRIFDIKPAFSVIFRDQTNAGF